MMQVCRVLLLIVVHSVSYTHSRPQITDEKWYPNDQWLDNIVSHWVNELTGRNDNSSASDSTQAPDTTTTVTTTTTTIPSTSPFELSNVQLDKILQNVFGKLGERGATESPPTTTNTPITRPPKSGQPLDWQSKTLDILNKLVAQEPTSTTSAGSVYPQSTIKPVPPSPDNAVPLLDGSSAQTSRVTNIIASDIPSVVASNKSIPEYETGQSVKTDAPVTKSPTIATVNVAAKVTLAPSILQSLAQQLFRKSQISTTQSWQESSVAPTATATYPGEIRNSAIDGSSMVTRTQTTTVPSTIGTSGTTTTTTTTTAPSHRRSTTVSTTATTTRTTTTPKTTVTHSFTPVSRRKQTTTKTPVKQGHSPMVTSPTEVTTASSRSDLSTTVAEEDIDRPDPLIPVRLPKLRRPVPVDDGSRHHPKVIRTDPTDEMETITESSILQPSEAKSCSCRWSRSVYLQSVTFVMIVISVLYT